MQTPIRIQLSISNLNRSQINLPNPNPSPLNAIPENEEEDITQTIPNSSLRKYKISSKLIQISQNNNQSQQQSLIKSIEFNQNRNTNLDKSHPSNTSSLVQISNLNKNMSKSSINFLDESDTIESKKESLNNLQKDIGIIYPANLIYIDDRIKTVSYREFYNLYSSLYIVKNVNVPIIKSNNNAYKYCCFKQFLFQFLNKYKLDEELHMDREVILYIAAIEFDVNNEMHWNMMVTLFWGLYDSFGDKWPKKKGKEWQLLFDAQSPSFPNEKGGLYAMMQIVYIIEKYPRFIKELMIFLDNEEIQRNFIIEYLCSITMICLDYIENNELNVYFNKARNITETLCEFYVGFIYQVKINLTSNMSCPFTSEIIAKVIKSTKESADKIPSSILWKYKQFKENYFEEVDNIYLSRSCAESYK